jgi:hypothetical protein
MTAWTTAPARRLRKGRRCRSGAGFLILSRLKADNDDQRFGIEIVRKAIQTPPRRIADNPGEDGAVIAGLLVTTEAMIAEPPEKKARRCHRVAAAWATWTSDPAFGRNRKERVERPALFLCGTVINSARKIR